MGLELETWEQPLLMVVLDQVSTRGASNTNAIWGASIKMSEKDPKTKWISAAVCLLFSED